jgi:glycosyltransferase involved in cell wall biosynthesis
MKILLVNKFHYLKGGSEKYYFTMAKALESLGHQVIYFAMHDPENLPCQQSPYFVSPVGVNGGFKSKAKMVLHMNYSKEAYQRMNALLDKEHPDIAILNLVHKQITLSIIDALKEHHVKIVWTMHDLITVCPAYTMLDGKGTICEKCLDGNFHHCFENKCIHGSKLMSYLSMKEAYYIRKRHWYDDVDLYVCPSLFYKNMLEKAHFTKSPIIYLPNPLPIDTTYEMNDKVEDYLLYFGRLSKEKGVGMLVEAMKEINYRLIILGTGPEEEELKKTIAAEHLENKISMLGFKQGQELTDYIRKAKAVILPSQWYENGPYSAMEAMALGKPLIVSQYGGLPELVENGKNGFIFHNKQELVEYINKITKLSFQEYLSLGQCSLEMAKSKFNPTLYVGRLLKELENTK